MSVQRLAWRRPEWWTLGLSASAWLVLLAEAITRSPGPGSSHHHTGTSGPEAFHGPLSAGSHGIVLWSLMVVATMPPLVLAAIRATSRASLWHRRNRAIGGFLLGYLSPWLAFGLAVSAVTGATTLEDSHGAPAAAVGFGLAAAWQVTSVKRRALWSCHRTAPLSPDGWRADRDCIRYGYDIGKRCLHSCWAMMLACALAGHSLPAMACVAILGAVERYAARPRQLGVSGGLAGLAFVYAVLALTRT